LVFAQQAGTSAPALIAQCKDGKAFNNVN
jgi:hypothetical protein